MTESLKILLKNAKDGDEVFKILDAHQNELTMREKMNLYMFLKQVKEICEQQAAMMKQ